MPSPYTIQMYTLTMRVANFVTLLKYSLLIEENKNILYHCEQAKRSLHDYPQNWMFKSCSESLFCTSYLNIKLLQWIVGRSLLMTSCFYIEELDGNSCKNGFCHNCETSILCWLHMGIIRIHVTIVYYLLSYYAPTSHL